MEVDRKIRREDKWENENETDAKKVKQRNASTHKEMQSAKFAFECEHTKQIASPMRLRAKQHAYSAERFVQATKQHATPTILWIPTVHTNRRAIEESK